MSEKAHAWIPWALPAVCPPAPICKPGQKYPDRLAHGPGKMGYGRIDAYDQVEAMDHGRRVGKIFQFFPQVGGQNLVAISLTGGRTFLKADEGDSGKGLQCRQQFCQGQGTLTVGGVAPPDDPDPGNRSRQAPFPGIDLGMIGKQVGYLRRDGLRRRAEDCRQAGKADVAVDPFFVGSAGVQDAKTIDERQGLEQRSK